MQGKEVNLAFVYWIHAPHHTDIFTEGYVGFTSTTIEDRMVSHKSDSVRTKCKNYPVYHAFRKYGDSLIVETIVEGPSDYCLDFEYKLRPTAKLGWNLLCGGQRGSLGTVASEETRNKQSEARRGDKNHFYGRSHSEDTKQKISDSKKLANFRYSDKQKAEMSRLRKGVKKNYTDEQLAAISARCKGRVISEEQKAALSRAMAGKYLCWNSCKANKKLWSKADMAFSYLQENPDSGERKLSTAVLGEDVQCKTLLKKLRSGWIPFEDQQWLDFKEQYEKDQYGT